MEEGLLGSRFVVDLFNFCVCVHVCECECRCACAGTLVEVRIAPYVSSHHLLPCLRYNLSIFSTEHTRPADPQVSGDFFISTFRVRDITLQHQVFMWRLEI